MQNTEGVSGKQSGMLATAIELKNKYGYGVFYDGITPKMIRAAINHAVTFYIYEFLIKYFQTLYG
jgi:solute carrier family 25 carnitine/acylcarnitine transporter 20/29